ncbi:MAG: hypothetical protein C5B48_01365 [Candidatus Rokuibacteriota bacterium]|nr:MAG: hypothetical protein C5B48_01365 [Candidatus Rokubacteria bacterium]
MTELADDAPPSPPDSRAVWRRMVQSFVALGTGEAVARLLGFAATVVMARRLGPSGYGVVTVGLTLVAWFAIVVNAGTETLNVRDIARSPERFRELVDRVLGLRITLAVISATIFALGALALAPSPLTRAVYVRFALVLLPIALNVRWMVLGVGGAPAVAAGIVASRLVFLCGVVLLVMAPADTVRVPYLEAVGEAIYAIVILALLTRRFGFARPRVDLPAWRETLRHSLPLMVNALALAAVLGFDVVVIEVVLGPARLGVYGAALKPVLFLLGSLGLLSVSFLASYSAAHGAAAEALFVRTARTVTGLMLAAAVLLTAAAIPLVDLLYGRRYHASGPLLATVAWAVPFAGLSLPYASTLIAGHHQRRLARNNIVTAGFTIAADLVAVPVLGLHGAAAVRVASAAVALTLNARAAVSLGLAPPPRQVLLRRPPRRAQASQGG